MTAIGIVLGSPHPTPTGAMQVRYLAERTGGSTQRSAVLRQDDGHATP
jgi:hypothetical protein